MPAMSSHAQQTSTSHIIGIVLTHSGLAIAFTLASKAVLRVIQLSLASLWIQSLVSLSILLVVAKTFPAASISVSKPWVVSTTSKAGTVSLLVLNQPTHTHACCISVAGLENFPATRFDTDPRRSE